ncbi:DUF397 domain-containing protein [Kitasatospora sp. RB6PN24]|uniref:DUF397 domain-containing protein n=1 Tax=Kitasatospora humi TaxID=2893891 RepID=UPI001E5F1BAA|nr:DUF397 domain-containing protein [Kitasatospora humi]MCC9306530.1 DUF397 domain-containing protein [Kitasatospora humi]
MTPTPEWFKSSYSSNGGACVEVAANILGTILVGTPRTPSGPHSPSAPRVSNAFVQGVKSRAFRGA